MRILLLLLMCVFLLVGCGIKGEINRTTTTTTVDPNTNVRTTVVEECVGSYSNTSWGTANTREAHGCDAGGGADGVDNTAMIQVPLSVLKVLATPMP